MEYVLFLIFLAACLAAGSTGSMFMPGEWYRRLNKPWWTPPDLLFPIAWAIIYVCMAAAGARVAMLPGAGLAMALWSLQIALNGLWTPVFFGLKKMKLGLIVVGALWVAVACTMLALFQQDRIAGFLFVPYLAWVSVATALNATVLRMNPLEAAKEKAGTPA